MIATGCSRHPSGAVACPTCLRIRVEADIVTRTVDALLAAGYALNVNNGGDEDELPAFTPDRDKVLAVLMDTDEDVLLAHTPWEDGWVQFIYGNDGIDVISDYTVNLEAALAPVNAYADQLGGGQ